MVNTFQTCHWKTIYLCFALLRENKKGNKNIFYTNAYIMENKCSINVKILLILTFRLQSVNLKSSFQWMILYIVVYTCN
jgi:hypothetical protein